MKRERVNSSHSILSDIKIFEYIASEQIVYDPFNKENIKTSSVDVTLGEWYFRPNPNHGLTYFNPWSKEHIEKIYGEPQKASLASEVFGNNLPDGVCKDDKIIIAYPGQMLLCHTEEFIGGVNEVTTMMKARSSIGRCDIVVCNCAGWGDVGYFNRWTMEVKTDSFGFNLPVILTTGRRVAQITFFETGPTIQNAYSESGKYQTSTDLNELKKNWNPKMMLPRLWKDKEIRK